MPFRLRLHIRKHLATPELKKAYNHGLFTRIATEYDQATRLLSLGRDQFWKRCLVDSLPPLSNPRCLDLACGTGDVSFQLAHRYPQGQILGVDLTPSMIEVARSRRPPSHLRFLEQDMCHLQLPDGWADIVTGSYALRNAPTLEAALTEINRVLRPGGWAAFLDFTKPAAPIPRRLQLGLLKIWGAFCGLLVHGGPEHAYIAESLRQFPDRHQFHRLLLHHGLNPVRQRSFMLGMLELLLLLRKGSAGNCQRPTANSTWPLASSPKSPTLSPDWGRAENRSEHSLGEESPNSTGRDAA